MSSSTKSSPYGLLFKNLDESLKPTWDAPRSGRLRGFVAGADITANRTGADRIGNLLMSLGWFCSSIYFCLFIILVSLLGRRSGMAWSEFFLQTFCSHTARNSRRRIATNPRRGNRRGRWHPDQLRGCRRTSGKANLMPVAFFHSSIMLRTNFWRSARYDLKKTMLLALQS